MSDKSRNFLTLKEQLQVSTYLELNRQRILAEKPDWPSLAREITKELKFEVTKVNAKSVAEAMSPPLVWETRYGSKETRFRASLTSTRELLAEALRPILDRLHELETAIACQAGMPASLAEAESQIMQVVRTQGDMTNSLLSRIQDLENNYEQLRRAAQTQGDVNTASRDRLVLCEKTIEDIEKTLKRLHGQVEQLAAEEVRLRTAVNSLCDHTNCRPPASAGVPIVTNTKKVEVNSRHS